MSRLADIAPSPCPHLPSQSASLSPRTPSNSSHVQTSIQGITTLRQQAQQQQQQAQAQAQQQQGNDDVQMYETTSITPSAAGYSANYCPPAHLIIIVPAFSSDASSQGQPEPSSLDGADARQAKRRRGLLSRLMSWLK
jgi:transcription initiation factor TFIID subunit TAF12